MANGRGRPCHGLIRHRTLRGGADAFGVFGEDAFGVAGLGLFPGGFAFGHFGFGDVEVHLALGGVDGEGVAILHQGEGAADIGFGADVADDEAVAAAGEASIGDEGDVFAEAASHHGAGRPKHFAHAGAAHGAFHADDDDIALLDLARHDGGHAGFLAVEDAGGAGEGEAFLAGDFSDRAFGGEVSIEDHEVAVGFDGVVHRADDGLAFGVADFHLAEIFLHGAAGDGHEVAMEQAFLEERLHEREGAADLHEVGHDVFAAGFQIRKHRRACADAREVVDF